MEIRDMALVSEATLETFHNSFERCISCPEFFDIFYERFFASSDEIVSFFEGKDLPRILKMVKDALFLILMASDKSSFATKKIESLASFHAGLGVQPAHYDFWLSALLCTVEENDPQFDQDVADAWSEVLSHGLAIMKAACLESSPSLSS